MRIAKALTIAGSDSGGGAGIQADLKTFSALGVYGSSALTAITAQNTQTVTGIFPLPPEIVAQQIEAVLTDIGADAIKTGMLSNATIVRAVATVLQQYRSIPLVVDPVMFAKSGDALLVNDAVESLRSFLLPLATVITPNLPEAEVLSNQKLETEEDCRHAAKMIQTMGPRYVIIKGGHRPIAGSGKNPQVVDLFYDGVNFQAISGPWIDTVHTHGTGCTFSAAITALMAKGKTPLEATLEARTYLTAALQKAFAVGAGKSPVHHFHKWWTK